jgi:DnaJ-class molecular chaperone
MINTEKTGNMVKNMKKLSNSKDNISSNKLRWRFSGADFGEGEDFSDFFQNMFGGAGGLAEVQEEELQENLKDRIYRQN